MRTYLIAFVLLAFVSCSTVGTRSFEAGDWKVTGEAHSDTINGGDFGDSSRTAGAVSVGRFFSENFMLGLEAQGGYTRIDPDGPNDAKHYSYSLAVNPRYYLNSKSNVRPYIGLGAGARQYKQDFGAHFDDSDVVFLGTARAGADVFFTDYMSVDLALQFQRAYSAELHGIRDDIDTLEVTLGLSIWF